ncbi:LuxR C-terminal-related transcriptional regulator [Pseudonocardia sp. DSM 110487]|uniref:LuxR C-terminal-related transcriptional regulator n=1 Tax=Pseudonocardia sp. DSM 110487 TaxID=2865833 RepID=UPI001C699FD3|nr:LuxR C-terminal-related transcriptional regulator [Pseudonocardia sp. DSM 110487]QYN33335.1 LuxR C-terminal-related transcriptional regulator [Pseudonocardia sp. DSM 110487]
MARPDLLRRLSGPARVTLVSAPPGSGKTVLLRSWISQTGLEECAAWVAAGREERDPPGFWLSVLGALRRTRPGAALVRALTAAPDLDGWAITERLLKDLAALEEQLWLVVDDVHELGPETLRQLELLMMRAPRTLRFVLAARHDVRLGLHRPRLDGDLAEIRANDLRFSLTETEELLAAAGVELPESAVAVLHERTEGWAAGLRLAALAAAGHPDPSRFAAEFSGTERTVAEYLMAEVLDRQPDPVRWLLLRTSILERVNGELADLLAGGEGGERVLQDLEQANAFVVSLDAARSEFRYHQMFAGLLQMELRRAAPGEVPDLHRAAAGWLGGHGYPAESVRHAQAARDWSLATRLLAEHWSGLYLSGRADAVHELLAGFPTGLLTTDAGLAAVAAGDELARGSLQAAERLLRLAERGTETVPDPQRGQLELLSGVVGLLAARQRGNPPAEAEAAQRLQAMSEALGAAQPYLGEDLRALALISLGYARGWTGHHNHAEHLAEGIALARRIGRPYLEFTGLAHQGAIEASRSLARAAEFSRQAIELADRHGWSDESAAGTACMILGAVLAWQGRLGEADTWVQRAEHIVSTEADPAAGLGVRYARGFLELVRGQYGDALTALRDAERLAGLLAAPHLLAPRARTLLLIALVRLGETQRAEETLADLEEREREHGEVRIATAELRLAQADPHGATVALAPVLDGSARVNPARAFLTLAFTLEAAARDALGDPDAAGRALERALDLAEPDTALSAFVLHPVPVLLERHARRGTTHAALIGDIRGLLAGHAPAPLPGGSPSPLQPLSDSELRVLRYLPTNLTAPEIAGELYVSVNTVKTHMRNLYAKLATHRRGETVARARDLGLLAPHAFRS